ncbi:MAG: ligase-associated DNA damage response endonuclease PdeM [Paracoccaceae bacterium]
MSDHEFELCGARLRAMASGALWWPKERTLIVSDLHLGRSERMARKGGPLLPPYEVQDTLMRLDEVLGRVAAARVICLGDTFDDRLAAGLAEPMLLWLARMMAGRQWIWIEGNHDPGPLALGGEHLAELALGPLVFRHIAKPGAQGEVSGHYHPKIRLAGQRRPCFLTDRSRVILPAFGTYTGGMDASHADLRPLFGARALAIVTGKVAARPVPF